VLVVRAFGGGSIRNEYSEAQYSDSVFGDNVVNLKTQASACSHGKLNFIATDYADARINDGVITVTVDEDPGVGVKVFEIALLRKLESMFGVTADVIADHVMLCYPDKTINGPAYAYLNYWLSA
jgi:hypothetical protein